MKNHRNPILNGVIARIRQLLDQYEESKAIGHPTTIGSLREAYLKQFLAGFIPQSFGVKGGFVTDSRGDSVSPQIDLIIFDEASIPSFALSEFVSIIPIEATRIVIEVKSTLKAVDLQQLLSQQEAFRQMRFAWTSANRQYLKTVNCTYVPQIAVSFDSECSRDTITEWFKADSGLVAVCVIGKHIHLRNPNNQKIEIVESDENGYELLQLASFLQTVTRLSQEELSNRTGMETPDGRLPMFPNIGAYIAFDVPYPEPDQH